MLPPELPRSSGSHVSAGANGGVGARLFKPGEDLVGLRLTVPRDELVQRASDEDVVGMLLQIAKT